MQKTTSSNIPPRQALGKGLASLLPGAANSSILSGLPPAPPLSSAAAAITRPGVMHSDDSVANKERIPGITMIDIELIVPNQYQPRRDFDLNSLEELAASIRANGIIQPLVIRRGDDGKFNLIAGERRLRASKLAGLKHVPVVIRKSTDKEALELALIENLQREDLNCVDIALSYFQLIEDFNLTQEAVATRVGKDRASVANHLRLLKLPDSIIQDLREAKLSFGHGRSLLAVADPLKRMEIRNKIVEKNLSVRDTERLVTDLITASPDQTKKSKKEDADDSEELLALTDRIGRAFGTRVSHKGSEHRGALVIEYFSKEDLQRLSEQLLR